MPELEEDPYDVDDDEDSVDDLDSDEDDDSEEEGEDSGDDNDGSAGDGEPSSHGIYFYFYLHWKILTVYLLDSDCFSRSCGCHSHFVQVAR